MIILFTSALISEYYEQRKNEYIESFNSLISFNLCDYTEILECINDGGTKSFLDDLTDKVYYTNMNYRFKNKGVNEILNIKKYLDIRQMNDEEKIIKMTGRYILQNNFFVEKCKYEDYDVIFRRDNHEQVFFGLFCAKKKVLIDFINSIDWNYVELRFISIEKIFAEFLQLRNYTKLELQELHIKCNINNNDLHYL
jgi:hypothetical protein